MSRRDDVAANLGAVRRRIAAAALSAGRDPAGVTLVAVTKTFPASDVRLLADLGVRDVGENRDQEAAPKVAELGDLDLRWHFVGRLQTNKCRSVASYAHLVHSVDRTRLVRALAAAAERADRVVGALVQVALDDDPQRGGAPVVEVARVADAVAAEPALRLCGVMAVAPLTGAFAEPDRAFARLAELAAQLRRDHPEADVISAGMSADLEAAVAHGATHVRVGTALLGGRPPLVR